MNQHASQDQFDTETSLTSAIMPLLYQNADQEKFLELQRRCAESALTTAQKSRLLDALDMALKLSERFNQYQQRERGLNAVIESAQDLTAVRDIDQALQAVVRRARKLMGTDVGYLSIHDPQRSDFYVRATDGTFSDKFKKIRVGSGIGVCGYVATNKCPYSSVEYDRDPRFSHTSLIDAAVIEEGIKCILGVPLLSGDAVLGVLFVGDRYVRSYSAWEMSILSTLAAHASVAIDNARLFEQTQTALKQVNDANALLKQQSENAQIAAEAHEQLTTLVARGGGLKDICETVATMLHGYVLAIDEGEQVICGSSFALDQSPQRGIATPDPDQFVHDDAIHVALMNSRTAGRSVHALIGDRQICRVSAVIGNRGLLGGLVIVTDAELTRLETRIFERSALVAGIVLLTQERKNDAGRREIPAIFRGLLGQPQRDLVRLIAQAGHYGLDLTQPLCIAIVEIKQIKSGYALNKIRASSQLAHILVDEVDDSLVFISALSADELRTSLEQLFKREQQAQITGVISKVVTQLTTLPMHYQSLMRCVDVLAVLGRCGSIFLEEELALYGVLFDQGRSADMQPFLASALGKLNQTGKPRSTELPSTLLSYLDHGYNARAAAADLGIHINTLHQRLDAIEALIGDWRERHRALEIHVALRLMQISNSAGNAT